MTSRDEGEASPRSYMFRALRPEDTAAALGATASGVGATAAHHVVVLGMQGGNVPEATVAALAKGLRVDPYNARQRLATPCPRVLRREENEREAQRWVAWLRALELAAFAAPEAAVALPEPVGVATFIAEPDTLVFGLVDGSLRRVARREVLCLVTGTVRERMVRETVASPNSSPLAGGGLPVGYEVTHQHEEAMADVHVIGQSAPLRLTPATLDARSLFGDRPPPTLAQMAEAVRLLRTAVGGAPVYDQFEAASGALGDSWQVMERSTDLVRRRASVGASLQLTASTTFAQSDRASFDLYSQLLRLQRLHA